MNYTYGNRSKLILSGAKPELQQVFNTVIKLGLIDVSILESMRGEKEQNEYYDSGKSKVAWPDSKHNVLRDGDKSEAVDAAPYVNGAVSWNPKHCIFLAGIVCAVGAWLGIKIRWGGNWDMDGEPVTDQDFQDLAHYELVD